MNLTDSLRGLLRRWYIVLPGIIAAVAVVFGLWTVVKPGYERSATQLLLPGKGALPTETSNPYLYIGGLSQAADVLVLTLNSGQILNGILEDYPGTDITISRDPSTAGPVVLMSVTATTDAAAAAVVDSLVDETTRSLERLQSEQNIPVDERITTATLAVDDKSTLQQRTRLVTSVGGGIAVLLFSLVLASLVDGLARRVNRAGRRGRKNRKDEGRDSEETSSSSEPAPAADDADDLTDAAEPKSAIPEAEHLLTRRGSAHRTGR